MHTIQFSTRSRLQAFALCIVVFSGGCQPKTAEKPRQQQSLPKQPAKAPPRSHPPKPTEPQHAPCACNFAYLAQQDGLRCLSPAGERSEPIVRFDTSTQLKAGAYARDWEVRGDGPRGLWLWHRSTSMAVHVQPDCTLRRWPIGEVKLSKTHQENWEVENYADMRTEAPSQVSVTSDGDLCLQLMERNPNASEFSLTIRLNPSKGIVDTAASDEYRQNCSSQHARPATPKWLRTLQLELRAQSGDGAWGVASTPEFAPGDYALSHVFVVDLNAQTTHRLLPGPWSKSRPVGAQQISTWIEAEEEAEDAPMLKSVAEMTWLGSELGRVGSLLVAPGQWVREIKGSVSARDN